ncbi:MAG: hypothetical protein K2N22_01590 [Clostridia bacterium]|nr:hypothetical protein [Clostridia bacterium]
MSKNKFIKKLLLGGICALTATTMIGATACKDKTPEGEGGHTHKWATEWTNNDPDGHYYACLATGHTGDQKDFGKHDIKDGECTVCHYKKTDNPNPGPGPDEEDPNVVYATQKYTVNVSDLSSLEDGDAVGTGTGITAVGKSTVDGNSKTVLYNGTEISVTNRLKLGGAATATSNALKFEIANDNSVIVIHAYSGSSTSEDGSHIRSLAIKDENFEEIDGQPEQCIGDGNSMGTAIFEVNKGTYYVGSTNKGINIYHIAIWEGGKLKETTVETKEAKDPTCEEKGNIAYTKTNFGRYKDDKNQIVFEYQLYSDELGHAWEIAADYVNENGKLKEEYIPTATESKDIKLHCTKLSHADADENLPVLSDTRYTRLTHDDAPEMVDEGKCNYAFKTDAGYTVNFTTVAVGQQEYNENVLHSNFLNGTVAYGKDGLTGTGGIKIYGTTNVSGKTAWDANYDVTASNNTLTVKDTGSADNSKKSAFAYILFDTAKTTGLYKVTGTINVNVESGNWCPLQLISNDSTNASDTFATLRTTKNKYLYLNNSTENDDNASVDASSFIFAKDTDLSFELTVDLTNKKVSLTVKNGKTGADAKEYKGTVSVETESWLGFKLQTADSADRTVILKNLVISELTPKNS